MNQSTLDILQGELERLFDLDALLRLSTEMLGFDPAVVGGATSKGTFARSLVGYCGNEDALPALVDAILLTSNDASSGLRDVLKSLANGELPPGTKVGALKVVRKIGEGGLSVVYLAEADGGAQAALKVIRTEYARDRAAVHRFTTASRVMQALKAPGLARILGVGKLADSRPWVAAQLVSGQSLAERIKRTGCIHMNEARPIFEGVLRGLAALHTRGLFHGDIKAENVFVVRPDESGRSGDLTGVLVDAGTDRLLSRVASKADVTGTLPLIGTAKALAPEQARGAEPDARSDIYAMGTLIYETLAGRPPFVGESAIDVIAQHLSTQPEPPSLHARKGWVSDAIDDMVLRALAKEPSERYQSAAELLEALEAAARRPGKKRPLDEIAFNQARSALLASPGDEAAADAVESQARDCGAWDRAATVFSEAARTAGDGLAKLALLFRAARIYETDLKDALRAEAAYQQILEFDPGNEMALRGVEAARRASSDYQGLLEILLERIDTEASAEVRMSMLHEVATIYEEKLLDPNNAVVAWVQALVRDPSDSRALRAVERLAATSDARMSEAIETLSGAAQESHAALFGDEHGAHAAAEQALAQAQDHLAQMQAYVTQQAQQRVQGGREARALRGDQMGAAQQQADQEQAELEAAQARHGELALRVRELAQQAQEQKSAHEAAHGHAEAAVAAYEQAEAELGEAPSEAQQNQFSELAAQAEQMVEVASNLEAETTATLEQLTQLQDELAQSENELGLLQARFDAASQELESLQGDDFELLDEADDGSALALTDEEADHLSQAEQQVTQAHEALSALVGMDETERAAQRNQDLSDLVQIYVIMGRWYGTRLGRPDFALSCFTQGLSIEPDNEAAFDGIIDLYRASQAWNELASTLLSRADRGVNPVKARSCRAQAAVIIAQKLGDEAQARTQLERVLAEDSAHELAQETLGRILASHQDFPALAALLERRLLALDDAAKVDTRLQLAELYEDRLGDLERAESHYAGVVELAPRRLDAWKGLERLHSRKENYEGLLASLRAQVELAPTPRQRIGLFERIGLLLEEEFVNPADAVLCFEDIVSLDPNHDAANTALARLYRQLSRFEDVVETLQRHATAAGDDKRKVELMLQAVRVLTVDIGSPERAMEMCERILEVDSEEPEALSELARLKSTAGDVSSALSAVERLADNEQDPHKRAEHWVRAGKLLEEAGDRDAAISRYKKALDSDRTTAAAADALRGIYARRGDAHGAIEMLMHAIEMSDGELKRAQLFAELGALYRERLEDDERAEDAFNTALELDATSTIAQVGLGQIAFGRGKHEEAADHLGAALGKLDDLPKDRAAEVCLQAGESFKALEQLDKALDAFKRARDYMPDDLGVNERHAQLVKELGDAKAAERLYERIYSKFESELDVAEKCRVLRAWGDTQLAAKHGKQAIDTFKKVLELKADDAGALDGLTRAYEDARNWTEVINLLQLRSRKTTDPELRFKLLVQTGDVFLEKIRDRDAAAQTYVMALDLEPDNRNLLTKLMGVYSDAQDWSRLIEVILRIAEMVQAPDQLAKYYNTAATIAHQELGRFDEAANYYEEALANLQPTAGQAQLKGLVECLTQNQDWERLERAYEARAERMREAGLPGSEVAAVLDARAQVLSDRLGRTGDALVLFEQAQSLDPQNRQRREMLTAVYTKEPKRYFARAVASHRELLAEDPYRLESLQALRRVYTSGKRPDESWCLCQALRWLQMADVDEEKFFKKYRLASLPKARRALDEEMYRRYVWHPAQEPGLTAIFSTLTPAIIATQSQSLESLGVDPRNYTDPATDPTAMGRMLQHVAELTATRLPTVYHCPNDAGGLSFLFSSPPAIGIGQGARAGGPQQALAFVAGRHASYFRSGHYIRQLIPTGTGLRTWLFAAIRLVSPKFPIPATMEGSVKECGEAIRAQLTGPQRDALRSMTQKLLEAAPELDMKGWMAGVDLSADRLGFIASNDLKVANAVIEASPEDASVVSRKDRQRELLVYSVSESYFELRKAVGIALGA
ncbi:MAG TPA: protein kinase [Polyangiales bacterium]